MVFLDKNHLMMIEPKNKKKEAAVNDKYTRYAEFLADIVTEGNATKGWHTCSCGARSGSLVLQIDNIITNSLLVHYVRDHRSEVPQEELKKLEALYLSRHKGPGKSDREYLEKKKNLKKLLASKKPAIVYHIKKKITVGDEQLSDVVRVKIFTRPGYPEPSMSIKKVTWDDEPWSLSLTDMKRLVHTMQRAIQQYELEMGLGEVQCNNGVIKVGSKVVLKSGEEGTIVKMTSGSLDIKRHGYHGSFTNVHPMDVCVISKFTK